MSDIVITVLVNIVTTSLTLSNPLDLEICLREFGPPAGYDNGLWSR